MRTSQRNCRSRSQACITTHERAKARSRFTSGNTDVSDQKTSSNGWMHDAGRDERENRPLVQGGFRKVLAQMNSTTWEALLDQQYSSLSIPLLSPSTSILDAAIAYGRCGWYILFTDGQSKNPGSLVGAGWQEKSVRDETDIRSAYSSHAMGIALHAGRSGAFILDVDHPEHLPKFLKTILEETRPPFQATRLDGGTRGHYVFAVPHGESYGNSNGTLGTAWGEVRCKNGVIIVEPTAHSSGGLYKWRVGGRVPYMPKQIASHVRPLGRRYVHTPADPDQFNACIAAHVVGDKEWILQMRLTQMIDRIHMGTSRHMSLVKALMPAVKDAASGMYPMETCLRAFSDAFNFYKPMDEQTHNEFLGVAAWCMGQIAEMTALEKASHAAQANYEFYSAGQWIEKKNG